MNDYVVQTWYNKGGDALFSGLPLRLPLKLPVALPVFQKPVVAVRESSFVYLHLQLYNFSVSLLTYCMTADVRQCTHVL
jgi:hypothetical protein